MGWPQWLLLFLLQWARRTAELTTAVPNSKQINTFVLRGTNRDTYPVDCMVVILSSPSPSVEAFILGHSELVWTTAITDASDGYYILFSDGEGFFDLDFLYLVLWFIHFLI